MSVPIRVALSSQKLDEVFRDEDFLTAVELRAKRNRFYGFFYSLVVNIWFNFTIYILILLNTVTLALYRYDQSEFQAQFLYYCDIIFTVVFTLELVSKLIGLGVTAYVKDSFNVLDALIVLISLIDMVFSFIFTENDSMVMNAFRALRLLRMIKLARIWKAFQEILRRIRQSLVDVSNFSFILLLFMFIFALLGMELFAFKVFYDGNGELVIGKENI